jgi:hypothetical protein
MRSCVQGNSLAIGIALVTFATYFWQVLEWHLELLLKIMQALMIGMAKSRARKMRKMREMTMHHSDNLGELVRKDGRSGLMMQQRLRAAKRLKTKSSVSKPSITNYFARKLAEHSHPAGATR